MHLDNPPTKTQLLKLLLFFLVVGIGLPTGGLSLLHVEYTQLFQVLEQKPPFFTQRPDVAMMLGMPFAGVALLVMIGFLVFRLIAGRAPVVSEKQQNWFWGCLLSLMLTGLGTMIVGPFISNAYWGTQFRHAGYHRCPNDSVVTSGRNQFVWAQDPEFCHMRVVDDMIDRTDQSREEQGAYLRDLKED